MAKLVGATEAALAELHQAVAKHFLGRLKSKEPVEPAVLGHIVKFLNDNDIQCSVEALKDDQSPKGQELLNRIAQMTEAPKGLPFPIQKVG